jgi:glycosyltransferase involved in cell wall biosynthesis
MAETRGDAPPLLVFADDWGRHPSSCQHLVQRLLDRYAVTWVNTIGMRTPRLDWSTVRRGLEKVRHWSSKATERVALPPNLRVLNPWMWPWFSTPFDRRLNRELLLRQLRQATPTPPVVITTLPIVADLVGALPARRWVYYCVDDFTEWPGLDQRALRLMEEQLVRSANGVVAVSETLQAKLAALGRPAPLLSHGVDLEHWTTPRAEGPVPELTGLERPLVLFWGLVDCRMDTAWLRRLDAELTRGTIVLVGPELDADPEMTRLARVRRVPAVAFDHLPALAREAAVLIMPYADLRVTRALQPLKLKEYLATGKPVVVSALPVHRAWADCLDVAATAAAFATAVRQRLATGLPPEQELARRRLSAESWEAKAQQLEQWALADTLSPFAPVCGGEGGKTAERQFATDAISF